MATSPAPRAGRVHVVLVPGFAGFDALGQVEYYAGTTDLLRRWQARRPRNRPRVVLHYVDTLPTAGVATRAARLRAFLAKRLARGEIQPEDRIALVGHSTGGLDVRRMLHAPDGPVMHVDGGDCPRPDGWGRDGDPTAIAVSHDEILRQISRVVFLSVPQYGTNIADWVRDRAPLRTAAVAELRAAVEGSRIPAVERVTAAVLTRVADLTADPDIVLAARDALDETRTTTDDPTVRAAAQEAGSQLRLWLAHAASDFGAIDDLRSHDAPPQRSASPAHYDDATRAAEQALWEQQDIRTMSVATVSRRAFRFEADRPAPVFSLLAPDTWPHRRTTPAAAAMDVTYLLTYRACAGGPFTVPASVADLSADVGRLDTTLFDAARLGPDGPAPGSPIAVWDNDGIVNTASMLWPDRERTLLVAADHLDVVGHYALRPTVPSPDASGRRYASYDALRSDTGVGPPAFDEVWTAVLDFCAS